jgi:hypothetical protein
MACKHLTLGRDARRLGAARAHPKGLPFFLNRENFDGALNRLNEGARAGAAGAESGFGSAQP